MPHVRPGLPAQRGGRDDGPLASQLAAGGGNKKLFVALGGTAIKPGDFEIVRFPGVAVFLHQGRARRRRRAAPRAR